MRFLKHSQEPRFCLLSWSKPRGGRYSQEPTCLAFSQTFKSLLLPLKPFKAKRRTLQPRVFSFFWGQNCDTKPLALLRLFLLWNDY